MLTYAIILASSYLGLFNLLPLFHEPQFQNDHLAQSIRHLALFYLSVQLTSFVWRQKFVSEGWPTRSRARLRENQQLID